MNRSRFGWNLRRALLGSVVTAALIALPAWGAGGEQDRAELRISLDPARVSVEARHRSLSEVLAALGAKAGFAVIGLGSSPAVEHLAAQGDSVEDVVRQLLRGEDHALLFRAEVASAPYRELDTIVLVSRGRAASAAVMGEPGKSARTGPGVMGEAPGPEAGARTFPGPGHDPEAGGWDAAGADGGVVEGLLRAHARPTSPARRHAVAGADPDAPLAGDDEALAIATQTARESLRALIEGLATASSSLLPPGPPPAR